MPEAFYIIPMTSPPYSRASPQRPQYVDELQTNWSGHNLDFFGVYLCKVNTTEAKHTQLASQPGVYQLPREFTLDTLVGDMHAAARNRIRNICNTLGIPYLTTETLEQLIGRVLSSSLFELGQINIQTQFGNLPPGQQQKIVNLCEKWGIPYTSTDTARVIVDRCRPAFWNPRTIWVEEF